MHRAHHVQIVAGAAAAVVCCFGATVLFALGGSAIAAGAFGEWGLGAAVAGLAVRSVWRYRRRRACRIASRLSPEQPALADRNHDRYGHTEE